MLYKSSLWDPHLNNRRDIITMQGLGKLLGKGHSYGNSLIVFSAKDICRDACSTANIPYQSLLIMEPGVLAIVKEKWPCHHWASKAE